MKRKSLLSIFIFMMSLFILIGGAKAALPDKILISGHVADGDESNGVTIVTYSSNHKAIITGGGTGYPQFPVKHGVISESSTSSVNVYCTSGRYTAEPARHTPCSKTSWEKAEQKYGVGYIINFFNTTSSDLPKYSYGAEYSPYDRYYWTEMVINSYLGTETTTDFNDKKLINTGKTYSEIVAAANTYASSIKKPTVTATGGNKIVFKQGTDGYYYSEPITFKTTAGTITVNDVSNKKFIKEKQTDGSYIIKIAEKDIKPGTTEEVSISAEAKLEAKFAVRYDCGESYQAVTYGKVDTETLSDTVKLTGSIKGKTATKFSKISVVDQKELPGAKLRILNENKEVITDEEGNALYEWISTDEPHYIYGLPVGKYYLEEEIAPEGYVLSNELVEFEVKDDGSITEVVMENDLEVEVPDTLSSRSMLLLVIGMIDIALGIGILLYVKKNKVTE